MSEHLILASGSEIRQTMLTNAGVSFQVVPARIDEETVLHSMLAEQASPRDIADTLAEMKARKVALKHPDALVLGCDQVLDFEGQTLQKPKDIDDARRQLKQMAGKRHQILSAAVLYEDGKPTWRHVGVVRMQMRNFSDEYLDGYLERNWNEIRHCVGCYQLEDEGIRLFSRVDGDYFTVLGLPLVELLGYLTLKGVLQE